MINQNLETSFAVVIFSSRFMFQDKFESFSYLILLFFVFNKMSSLLFIQNEASTIFYIVFIPVKD